MKKSTFILATLILLTGCNSSNDKNSLDLSNSLSPNYGDVVDTIIKSPNEDGGLEGNAEDDLVKPQDVSVLKNFLLNVAVETYYTYEVTATVDSITSHFVQHFTPNAWYEENDNEELSFGYAEEKDTSWSKSTRS